MLDATNWSILSIKPEYLQSVFNQPHLAQQIQAAQVAAEDDVRAAMIYGTNLKPGEKAYQVTDGVAVIPLTGPLSKRGGFLSFIMGGTTYGQAAEAISQALNDAEVEAIVLDVDSPGGTVSGTDAFAEVVTAANQQKPVVAFANGCMCSAAYWAASGAAMIVAERTASVGSIGVLLVHADFSKMDENAGVKYTVLTAGRYKAVGNDYSPLTDEDREVIQAELDSLYNIFIDAVASNLGVDAALVREDMADGQVFIGQGAVDAGLVDQVGGLDTAIAEAKLMAEQIKSGELEVNANTQTKEKSSMKKFLNKAEMPKTVDELKAMFPELSEALVLEGMQSVEMDAALAAQAEEEQGRIIAMAVIHFGEEAANKFAEVLATGITDEQYKAIVGDTQPGLAAVDIQGKQEILNNLENSGAENPGAENNTAGLEGTQDFMALVDEHMATFKCTRVEAIKAITKANPKAHEAYLQKAQPSVH